VHSQDPRIRPSCSRPTVLLSSPLQHRSTKHRNGAFRLHPARRSPWQLESGRLSNRSSRDSSRYVPGFPARFKPRQDHPIHCQSRKEPANCRYSVSGCCYALCFRSHELPGTVLCRRWQTWSATQKRHATVDIPLVFRVGSSTEAVLLFSLLLTYT
jgi:hypothetical protein